MLNKIYKTLRPVYTTMGVTIPSKRAAMIRAVRTYLKEDREHFVALEDPDGYPYCSSPEFGVIGKLAPLWQSTDVEEDEKRRVENTEQLCLLMTDDSIDFVHTLFRTLYDKQNDEYRYMYPVYRIVDQSFFTEYMTPTSPEIIRPVCTDHYWSIYCSAFYAIERLTRDKHPLYVPYYTERAMFVLKKVLPKTVTVDGEEVTGQLLTIALESDPQRIQEENRSILISDELCLLITETEVRYVLETATYTTYMKQNPFGDGPDDYIAEAVAEDTKSTYKYIKLDDITKKMFLPF